MFLLTLELSRQQNQEHKNKEVWSPSIYYLIVAVDEMKDKKSPLVLQVHENYFQDYII
jgi:hypothetical protein